MVRVYLYENHSGALTSANPIGYEVQMTLPASVYSYGVAYDVGTSQVFCITPDTQVGSWSPGGATSGGMIQLLDQVSGWRDFAFFLSLNTPGSTLAHTAPNNNWSLGQTVSVRIRNFFLFSSLTWSGLTFLFSDECVGAQGPAPLPDALGYAAGELVIRDAARSTATAQVAVGGGSRAQVVG